MTTVSEYSIEKKYKILGFNDDQCSCDICGKQELKGTYAIEDLQNGGIIRAGSSCGAKMAGWTSKELVSRYKAGEKENLEAAKKELRSSKEYLEYDAAIEFLRNESDNISIRLFNTPDQATRTAIALTERTFQSRREYLNPFTTALEIKRAQTVEKYNLKKGTYLS